jgi:uncharacterized membrane protein YfcA
MAWPTVVGVVLIGGVAGFLGGLFGKGGSAIATPMLDVIGIRPLAAVASPLPSTIPGTIVAAFAYRRAGIMNWRVIRWSVIVGLPATVIGAYTTRWIGGGPLVVGTELLLVALGLRFLVFPGDPHEVAVDPPAFRTRVVAVAVAVGLLSGLLANAGGFLLAPLYVLVLRLSLKEAFGSSLVVAAALAVPGTIVHAALGHIDWTVVALFGAASIPFSSLGARTALRTNAAHLERLYGAGLAVIGAATLALSL